MTSFRLGIRTCYLLVPFFIRSRKKVCKEYFRERKDHFVFCTLLFENVQRIKQIKNAFLNGHHAPPSHASVTCLHHMPPSHAFVTSYRHMLPLRVVICFCYIPPSYSSVIHVTYYLPNVHNFSSRSTAKILSDFLFPSFKSQFVYPKTYLPNLFLI